jgi:hypothetical protein
MEARRCRSGGRSRSSTTNGHTDDMTTLAIVIAILLLVVIPAAIVGYLFVWAAVKDGEEDRALQRRLGIRRRTRLGR